MLLEKMRKAYHKAKNKYNKLKTKESMVDLKIKSNACLLFVYICFTIYVCIEEAILTEGLLF